MILLIWYFAFGAIASGLAAVSDVPADKLTKFLGLIIISLAWPLFFLIILGTFMRRILK